MFDVMAMPPSYISSVKLCEQPRRITFSLDGEYVCPSTGEVIDTVTKKVVECLPTRRAGRFAARRWARSTSKTACLIAAGDQFGIGRKE
jgi:hypothetical protein